MRALPPTETNPGPERAPIPTTTLGRAEEQQTVTIWQASSSRLLSARNDGDHNVVTDAPPGDRRYFSFRWVMVPQGAGIYTIMHERTGLYLDAHEIAEKDFHLVLRPRQTFDSTQLWRVVPMPKGANTIMQVSSGRYMDAHEVPELDYGAVSRPRQDNATQLWVFARQP